MRNLLSEMPTIQIYGISRKELVGQKIKACKFSMYVRSFWVELKQRYNNLNSNKQYHTFVEIYRERMIGYLNQWNQNYVQVPNGLRGTICLIIIQQREVYKNM